MELDPGLQVSLQIKGRSCVVIGGEDEAVEKIQRLLDAGANVTVINPTLHTTLRKLTASGKIIHRGRAFRTSDVQHGVTLVVNTLAHDEGLAKTLSELARTERFLVWSMDQPEQSTVSMPALVARGPLRMAISTSGASPALAKAIREQCDTLVDDECVDCLEWLGAVRQELKASEPSPIKRRERLQALLDGFQLNGNVVLPKAWYDEQARRATEQTQED